MRMPVTVDFETHGIGRRPKDYPPKPVGVAIRDGNSSRYWAWGHPTGNNCTLDQARARLKDVWTGDRPVLFHNAGFDLEVAEQWLDLPMLPWHRYHDTLFLAFLVDPHAKQLSLKPLAEVWLGEPPTEQDELREWILANVNEAKESDWGAYIWRAPGPLVGRYAKGDVNRTAALFKIFHAEVRAAGMGEAYDRERRLMPVLKKLERRGIPVAQRRLERDLPRWRGVRDGLARDIMTRLKVPKAEREEFKFSGKGFADALERAGKVDDWVLTKKGNRSVAADALKECCTDAKLVRLIEIHSQVDTCINTFGEPWLAQARETGGVLYPSYNQVRQANERGKGLVGARTGRLSMTPNMQNIIRSDKDDLVPRLRDYVVPRRGRVLIGRDYSQQELRIAAHYEDGPFLRAYLKNPTMDAHVGVGELIRSTTGLDLKRRDTKDLNFGIIYGLGLGGMAKKTGRPIDEVRRLRAAHAKALPGITALQKDLKRRAAAGEPIFTWGGRRYFCEEPKVIDGRLRRFDYKLLNVLVQGSAADCTKQAMINLDEADPDGELVAMLLQVHDELLGDTPKGHDKEAHALMRDAMADVAFDVPMLSDGKTGAISWDRMRKVGY